MISVALAMLFSTLAAPPQPPAAAPAVPTEVRQIVERSVKLYETAQSYEDTVVISTEIKAEMPLDLPPSASTTLAFVRPDKLAMTTPQYSVVTDGRRLWESMDVWMEYVEAESPKPLKLTELALSRFGFFRESKHPLLGLLLESDRSSLDFLTDKAQLTSVRAESLDGVPGKRIVGSLTDKKDVTVEVWFDDQTGLIGEVVYDHTKPAQTGAPTLKITQAVQRMRFKGARVNQPIPDSRFTFQPSPHLDKVSAFRMPTSQELQRRLVGKPAHAFTGKYLDGKEVSMADFKGRVLLLDFWSLRCGPCIYSMPTLQKVADKFAGKPVSIIGVNLDGAASASSVTELLKSRKISFAHLMSTKPALAEKYFVEGIPFAVLVDGKGIIQAIHLGMAQERELSEQIDRLLKGENLFSK